MIFACKLYTSPVLRTQQLTISLATRREALEQQLDRFLQEGFSAATRKVYRSGINRYLAFASEFQLPATPITHENLALFVAFLGAQNLSVSTIESYLSALLYLKLMQDPTCANPSCMSPYLKVLLRGIKRVNSRTGGTIRLPITAQLMRHIKSALQIQAKTDPYTPTWIWAAYCLGFFGFLRCSEFLTPDGTAYSQDIHLSINDISLDNSSHPWKLLVKIKSSKTDQFRVGTTVVLGQTGNDLCPIASMLEYLNSRGNHPGALFQSREGQPIHRQLFVSKVQQALVSAGIPGHLFNGHSFRIGAATITSAVGIPETIIKHLGRWSSTAYQTYIRPSQSSLAGVSQQLAS